jgi:geranylgeranyl diphosphate synthase type I
MMNISKSIDSLENSEAANEASFRQLVEKTRDLLDHLLAEILERQVAEVGRHGVDTWAVLDAARSLCLRGGKRLRAALVMAGCQACAGEANEEATRQAGMAVELLHAYLLIHDDWMDNDEVRRGGPSVHAALRSRFGSIQAGDSAAILAGDYVSALAQEVLCSLPISPERLLDAARVFARMHREVIIGQLLDVCPARRASVEAMHDLKTGSYTVRGPLLLGAAIAGASQAARTALEAFAVPLGVAFQLRDDLLGTFGDPRMTGKPVGNDLRQGKRTALVEEMEGDAALAPVLAKVFGKTDASDDEVVAVVHRLEELKVRTRIEERVLVLLDQARRALVSAPLTQRGMSLLKGAVVVLGKRAQ